MNSDEPFASAGSDLVGRTTRASTKLLKGREARLQDNPGTAGLTWEDVMNREYLPWPEEHILIDTAGQTPSQSVAALRQLLGLA